METSQFRIIKYSPEYYDKMIAFNNKVYKRTQNEKYFSHRFINHPLSNNHPHIFLATLDDEIVGQEVFLPLKFRSQKSTYSGYWGQDIVALPEVRNLGVGKELVKTSDTVDNMFVIGLTPISLKIYKRKGYHIYDFQKLIKLRSVFTLAKIFYKIKSNKNLIFPEEISINKSSFKKQTSAPEMNCNYWNENYLEFSRDKDFLNWRFFGLYDYFHFYFNNSTESPIYFVLKEITWKNMNFIALVDYRLKIDNKDSQRLIFRALNAIVNKTGANGIITGCSDKNLLKGFHKNGFFDFESKGAVMTKPGAPDLYPELKENRIFATMADTDFENLYKLDGNLHHRIYKGVFKKIKAFFHLKH